MDLNKVSRLPDEIAGYRRIVIFIIFAPMVALALVALNMMTHAAMSGFPDRRPILLYWYTASVVYLVIFFVKFLRPTLAGAYRIFMTRAPALFIEDGCLIYMSKNHFCISAKDAVAALTPGDNIFRKLILSAIGGRHTEIGLLVFDKSGPEIIDAINANRFQRTR